MNAVANGSLTILGAFLGGLALNLTPCVYPMLTITVSLFGGRQECDRRQLFFKSVIYVLGLATMYSTLGVVAAMTGEMFGSLLQNRLVLYGMGVLLTLLALSMLGAYTFQLPAAFTSRIGGRRQASLFGIYLSGLLVGVVAAPCIGPPVVAMMAVVGAKGDPVYAFFFFFIMSLGLGLPYLLLGTYSGFLRRLPKSGVWLVWVERFFGVVLLLMAAYFFILAVSPSLLHRFPSIALIVAGVYLGYIEKSGDEHFRFFCFKRVAGAAAILAGVILPLAGTLFVSKPKLSWDVFSDQKLTAAKTAGRPVILDFYADWCIPCHELDHYTYSNPEVMSALDRFVRLKVNLTRQDSPKTQAIADRFQIVGVPTIIFVDSKGKEVEDARATGFIPPDEMLNRIHHPRLKGPPASNHERPITDETTDNIRENVNRR